MASLMCVCVLLFNSTSQVTSRRRSTEQHRVFYRFHIFSHAIFNISQYTTLFQIFQALCVCVCFMLIFTFPPSLRSQSYFIISLCVRRFFQHILTNFIFFFHFVHFFTFIRSFQFFSFYLHALIVFFLLLLYFSASTTHRSSN